MIRMATVDDIDILVELRIKLLLEVKTDIENNDWGSYSQALYTFYKDNLSNGKVIAFLAEVSGNVVAISIMCFYNIPPLLNNLDGKMALLTDMYTVPEYRNNGLGTILLNNIMEYTKKIGV